MTIGRLPNPNQPLVVFEADMQQGPPSLVGGTRVSINQVARQTYVRAWDAQRGRQYELDQVQAGTATLNMVDENENLNPLNTASPFNSGGNTITSYRCLNISAFWPVTGNMYNPNVSSVFDGSFETAGSNTPFGATGGTCVLSSAQALFGTKSLLVTQGGNTSASYAAVTIPGVPGVTATLSVYAYLTGGCSLQITAPDGSLSSVLSTQTTWTRITVTYVMQDARDVVTFAGTVSATPTYYLDGFQVEWANTASTFTTTGPIKYQIYNGYIERYPTSYDMAGTRGLHQLQAVDALAVLSRTNISQSYDATVKASNPLWYAPLDNTQSPVQGTLGGVGTTNWQSFDLPNSSNGAVQWGSDSTLDGSAAMVMSQRNPTNPASSAGGIATNATSLDIIGGPLSLSTIATSVECWVKFTSGVFGFLNLSAYFTENDLTPHGVYMDVETDTGKLWFHTHDPTTGNDSRIAIDTVHPGLTPYPDAQWHYFVINFWNDGVAGGVYYQVDDVGSSFPTIWTGSAPQNIGYGTIHVGAFTGFGDAVSQGSVARIAVYARDIPVSEFKSHYNRGVGYINEMSGVRARRLLSQYWTGPMSVATGYLKMAPDFSYSGRTMLDVLQEIQESERGLLYVNRAGTVVFEDRSSRYATQTSVAVFGENDIPYVEYDSDFDPTYTFSQANLSRPANSNYPAQVNATSQAKYGQRILTQTMQCNTDFDLAQAATFYLHRYADPKVRVTTLKLSPSSNPALWPVLLNLEISQKITVKRKTAALSTSNDYYVEQIHHSADAETGDWIVELQLSPVFVPTAWILGDNTYGRLGSGTAPVY